MPATDEEVNILDKLSVTMRNFMGPTDLPVYFNPLYE